MFYFNLKAHFVFNIFNSCPDLFAYAEKRLDKKAKFHFKNYDVTNWRTNYYNSHIAQYLKK